MLKAAQRGPNGLMVLLGLSHANLELLPTSAIQFFAREVSLGEGVLVIAHADDPELPAYRAVVGSAVRALVVLDAGALATLRRGELVEVPLASFGFREPGSVLLFAGETEESLLAQLRTHGVVGPSTRVDRPPGQRTRRAPDDVPVVPALSSAVGAVACFYAAFVEGKVPALLTVLGLLLAGFAAFFAYRLYAARAHRS